MIVKYLGKADGVGALQRCHDTNKIMLVGIELGYVMMVVLAGITRKEEVGVFRFS